MKVNVVFSDEIERLLMLGSDSFKMNGDYDIPGEDPDAKFASGDTLKIETEIKGERFLWVLNGDKVEMIGKRSYLAYRHYPRADIRFGNPVFSKCDCPICKTIPAGPDCTSVASSRALAPPVPSPGGGPTLEGAGGARET